MKECNCCCENCCRPHQHKKKGKVDDENKEERGNTEE